MYYEDGCAEDHGYVHEDDLPDFDKIKDHLRGVVESVYESGNLDSLEHCLEELCHQFDMHVPAKDPVIWRNIA